MDPFKLEYICGAILFLLQNVITSPTVRINGSYITGQRIHFLGHEVNQYLGIPYAQPPVASLRYKKPLPMHNYPSEIKAVTEPPACPQYTKWSFPWSDNSTDKSEDCLYLNIWTPSDASPANRKAVFYWMYGGDYAYGSIKSELYSGIPLTSMGDIIVVTVNYRVGSFGFLTSGTKAAPGNVGLWDVLEGLKWVNQHIDVFGGDSNRITVGGQSSGAISVGLLSISPLAKGLYSRLIMESGSPVIRILDNNTMNFIPGQLLANSVGCANNTFTIETHPEEVVECLRGVDFLTLSKAENTAVPKWECGFDPQWGDDLLPQNPRTAVLDGNFRCADLLIGNNKDELSLGITVTDPDLYGFFGQKNPHINKTFGEDTIQHIVSTFPESQSIVKYYIPENLTEDASHRVRHQEYTALGDVVINCPQVYYAEKCAEQKHNVYFYLFTHRPSVTPWAKWMGVAHFEEVQFVFGQPILNPEKYQPSEVLLSRQMIDIWSSFVKHGKPDISWPLYSRKKPYFKYIGPKYVTEKNGKRGPHSKNCNFLRPFFE